MWDLYKTEPVLMSHPALRYKGSDGLIPVIVSKIDKEGAVYWNLDYIVSATTTGQGGSGFADNPLSASPEFDEEHNRWVVNEEGGQFYFYQPSEKAVKWWRKNKHHVWSHEMLDKAANQYYGEED